MGLTSILRIYRAVVGELGPRVEVPRSGLGGRGVGCIPATPPRDWHGLRVVGLLAERCAITEVLVSRFRGLVAVDGPGVEER
jgi:hypothetical protein